MIRRARKAAVLGLSLGVGCAAGAARAADNAADPAKAGEPTTQELLQQIEALKAKVDRLQAAQSNQDDRLTKQEVDRNVNEVLTDAERRSQLLQAQGFTAGYSKGKFIIQSEDGNFLLNPNIQLQARYIYNYREENAENEVDGDATNEHGFEIRRLKLTFEGNAFTPDTKYKFQWATNRNNGNLVLEEAFVSHRFAGTDYAVKLGQYKDVTFHEEITSSKRQLAVDRSLANEVLAGGQTDYIQGIALIWDDGPEGRPLRAEIGYTDGPNSDNTNFVDAGGSSLFGVANPDYGAYGRLEYLAFGDWKQYDDFTTMNNSRDLLVLGTGAFYTEAGDARAVFHTADAQYEFGPIGLFAAYYGVYSDQGDDGTAYDAGGVAQAGYMLNERWELFGRYSIVLLDSADVADDDQFHEVTAGVNYYLRGHAAKFTLDVVYLPNGVPINLDGIDELDPDADSDQFVFRGQFQLLL